MGGSVLGGRMSEYTCDRCPVEVANGHAYHVNGDRVCGECYELTLSPMEVWSYADGEEEE